MEKQLPAIPAKRYFTIGEVSDLCGVKPYVLRYWEQEFTQLKPMKRRGNRRYYQHHEVLLIRRIRDLLYDQGFTISGARNQLGDLLGAGRIAALASEIQAGLAAGTHAGLIDDDDDEHDDPRTLDATAKSLPCAEADTACADPALATSQLRAELLSIRDMLKV